MNEWVAAQGVARNFVVSFWEWASPKHYLHDLIYPFADEKCLQAADRLDLGVNARALSQLVERSKFPRLVAALARTNLAKDYDQILADASAR